jgi:hypothetical protein
MIFNHLPLPYELQDHTTNRHEQLTEQVGSYSTKQYILPRLKQPLSFQALRVCPRNPSAMLHNVINGLLIETVIFITVLAPRPPGFGEVNTVHFLCKTGDHSHGDRTRRVTQEASYQRERIKVNRKG